MYILYNDILRNYINYGAEMNLYTEKQVFLETCEKLVIKSDLSFILFYSLSLKMKCPPVFVCATVLCTVLHQLEVIF